MITSIFLFCFLWFNIFLTTIFAVFIRGKGLFFSCLRALTSITFQWLCVTFFICQPPLVVLLWPRYCDAMHLPHVSLFVFCAFSRFYPGLLLAGVGAVVPKCTIMLIFTTAFYVRERILHLLTVWSINVQSKRLSMPSAPTSLFHPSLVLPMQRCFSPFSVSVLQTQQKVHPTCWISWLGFFFEAESPLLIASSVSPSEP